MAVVPQLHRSSASVASQPCSVSASWASVAMQFVLFDRCSTLRNDVRDESRRTEVERLLHNAHTDLV